MVLIWVANLPKVRFCYRVVVGISGRTSVPILNLSTPPPGVKDYDGPHSGEKCCSLMSEIVVEMLAFDMKSILKVG